jgi:hypothetical protein
MTILPLCLTAHPGSSLAECCLDLVRGLEVDDGRGVHAAAPPGSRPQGTRGRPAGEAQAASDAGPEPRTGLRDRGTHGQAARLGSLGGVQRAVAAWLAFEFVMRVRLWASGPAAPDPSAFVLMPALR